MEVWFSPNHRTEFSNVVVVFEPSLRTTSWLNLFVNDSLEIFLKNKK